MLIKDVCRECNLTKKAVEYYEKKGLIQPEIGENGYRHYNDKDISLLKEISVLRKLGVSITDIKSILISNNKSVTLSKCKYLMELKLQRVTTQLNCIENLINNYDIDQQIEYIQTSVDKFLTIREKLIQAFPGTYGMYLCIHFGHFLNGKIDSVEKEIAYSKIISFLDDIDNLQFPTKLEKYLENYFSIMQKTDMEKMNSTIANAIDNIEGYIEDNKTTLEDYLKIRTSDEFKTTPAYQMQQLLLEFQQSNGYYDVFLPNLKILSTSYLEYTKKLEAANRILIEKYPQTKDLYN